MIIDLGSGKQVVVISDLGTTWLSIWACKGNLGVEIGGHEIDLCMALAGTLSEADRKRLSKALWYSAKEAPQPR